MVCLNPLFRIFSVAIAICTLFGYATGNPSPDTIGDILQEILGELASLGFSVTHFDLDMTVLGLLVGSASLDFNITSPLSLTEITIDQVSMQLGQNGTTFFSFNHTFTDFILPILGSGNSGTVSNVALTQGGLATLPLISTTSLDIIGAQYSIRVLTVNGTGGVSIPLNTSQIGVPTDASFQLLKE